MPIHAVPGWLQALAPGLEWQGPPEVQGSKAIYLTFDDGPVPGPTEFVLDTLAAYNAKATFFAVGENVERHPALAERIINEGHALANHTYHHVKGWGRSVTEYMAEVEHCDAMLPQNRGKNFFRPPYGRITPAQAKALQASHRIIMWSLLTGDYDKTLSPGKCLVATYRLCRPGSIVVFHDSYKAEGNLRAVLPALLRVLADEGYSCAALS